MVGLDHLVQTLNASLVEGDWASEFLALVCKQTQSHAGAVWTKITDCISVVGARFGVDAASVSTYESTFAVQNVWSNNGSVKRYPGAVIVSDDVVPLADMKQTSFWRNYLHQLDIDHGVGMIGSHGQESIVGLTLFRAERIGRYAHAESQLLNVLGPHWVNACRVREKLDVEAAKQNSINKVLDRLDLAVFVLDAQHRVRQLNATAERLAQGQAVVRMREKILQFNQRDAAAMERGLRSARCASTDIGACPTSCILLHDNQGVSRAVASIHALGSARDVALVFIQSLGQDDPSADVEAALRQTFELTSGEAKLAMSLIARNELGLAAAECGISTATARTRLKTVFDKTGAHTQMALAKLIATVRATVGHA